jgi:DNA-binding transcriptional regulator YdaS (Cro superfamily)
MTTKQAIDYFGSAAKLAQALKVTKGAVSQWGEQPPYLRQVQLELLSSGLLKADK